MKKNSVILAAIGAALLLLRRRQASGIGKVRRNIFAEIEELQSHGVSLAGNWDALHMVDQDTVTNVMLRSGYKKLSRENTSWRELIEFYAPTYYKQLCRQYLKLVNPAIGRIQYPHTTSVIRNSRGDVVLTYNDYDPERDMQAALDWCADSTDPYTKTVRAIASGHKFIWKGKKSGGNLLTRGLADELFFSRTNLEGERKLYRALIDNKNGWTVDKFVEQHLNDAPGAKDAALDALREFPTPKSAREFILGQYYKSLDDGTPDYEPEMAEDLPF